MRGIGLQPGGGLGGKLIGRRAYLPQIHTLTALHLKLAPSDYAALPQEDRAELENAMLYGASPLRQVILIGQIKNMLASYFTQKPVRSDAMPWLDGLLENPADVKEKREERQAEGRLNMHLAANRAARDAEKKMEGG